VKSLLFLIAITASLLGGCHHSDYPNQWIVESYSEDKGYVFRKNGVKYEAQCFLDAKRGEDYVAVEARWKQTTGSSTPPEVACFAVAQFVHQPILLNEIGGTNLVYYHSGDTSGTTYWFKITEEK
jgi:hypothetical protein